MKWPNNKDFAFSIVDDTDMSTLENVKPIYDLLIDCGLTTTKTVWVYPHEGTYFSASHTLQHAAYLEFVKQLQRKGFEIALHGARGCSSERAMIIEALEEFKVHFGSYPTMHINHAQNEDNLYWGFNKLYGFQKLLDKWGIKKYSRRGIGYGADPNSKYFWGDIAKEKIKYVRGKSYNSINQLKWDRFAPFHDDRLPLVNYWFSSCNGNEYTDFNKLLYLFGWFGYKLFHG